jgi:hypothetical protein
MYNPTTQVQVPIDANLGSYFQKTKIAVGASPTAFPFKKKGGTKRSLFRLWLRLLHAMLDVVLIVCIVIFAVA